MIKTLKLINYQKVTHTPDETNIVTVRRDVYVEYSDGTVLKKLNQPETDKLLRWLDKIVSQAIEDKAKRFKKDILLEE